MLMLQRREAYKDVTQQGVGKRRETFTCIINEFMHVLLPHLNKHDFQSKCHGVLTVKVEKRE